MQWEVEEANEPVAAWSCNPVSTRRKPHSSSHFQSHNWVHTGIVIILNLCSIWISRWCYIPLRGGHLASFSHIQRWFLSWASRQKGKGQSQCPDNRTCEEEKRRWGNKCWNLDAVQEAVRNEHLPELDQPRNRYFQGVICWLQLSKYPLDVSLGRTDSSILSLPTLFCPETWRSTHDEPQGRLECLQSQSQLPATSDHMLVLHSLLRNQRSQSPSPPSALGEQCGRLQSLLFGCWSGRSPKLLVICKAQIHGTRKPPWWKASWRYDQGLQRITRQYTRRNTLHGNVQRHTVVSQA